MESPSGNQDTALATAGLRGEVQQALESLHDPTALGRARLLNLLRLPPGPESGRQLQKLLEGAIERLAPDPKAGPGNQTARRHQLLHARYVQGREIADVCQALSVSRSHYFRLQREAVDSMVAIIEEALRDRFHPPPDENESAAAPLRPAPAMSKRRLSLFVGAAMAALAAVFYPALGSLGARASIPYIAVVLPPGNAVEVRAESGAPLFLARVDAQIIKASVHDLDADGMPEVIIGGEVPPHDKNAKDIGTIKVFDATGRLRWDYHVPANYPYEGDRSGRLTIRDFVVAPLFGEPDHQIAFIANDVTWHPSKVGILTAEGHLTGEYWHPGHLGFLQVLDTPEGPRLLVGGLNNDFRDPGLFGNGSNKYFGVLFGLPPRRLEGEAPPFSGRFGAGSHNWYFRIEPQGVTLDNLHQRERHDTGVTDIVLELNCGYFLQIDVHGNTLGQAPGDGYKCESPPHGSLVTWSGVGDAQRFKQAGRGPGG